MHKKILSGLLTAVLAIGVCCSAFLFTACEGKQTGKELEL